MAESSGDESNSSFAARLNADIDDTEAFRSAFDDNGVESTETEELLARENAFRRHKVTPEDEMYGDPETARVQLMSVNDAINEIGNGRFQLGIGALCGLSEASDGLQQLSVSFLLHKLGELFHMNNQQKARIGTVTGAGLLVGALMWGRISDMKGRKFAFVGTLLMAGIFGMLSATSEVMWIFLAFRFLLSVGIGGNVPLAFTVFTEVGFSPSPNNVCSMFSASVLPLPPLYHLTFPTLLTSHLPLLPFPSPPFCVL
jgi:Major Facilitator Superfamily